MKSLYSIEKIEKETFLRQFSKEKENLKDLAKHLEYDSKELTYLLSLLPEYEAKNPNSDVVSSLLKQMILLDDSNLRVIFVYLYTLTAVRLLALKFLL